MHPLSQIRTLLATTRPSSSLLWRHRLHTAMLPHSPLALELPHGTFPYRLQLSCAAASKNGAAADCGKVRGPIIAEVPLDQIRRPLLRTRNNDPEKVKALMESIAEIGLQEPIDVLEVDGIYYGFSGCHRFEAHQRLGLPTIRCKIRRGTKETLRHHLR